MSPAPQIARLFLLVAICSGVAFSGARAGQDGSDTESLGSSDRRPELAHEIGFRERALPRSDHILYSLVNLDRNPLPPLVSIEAKALRSADSSKIRITELEPQRLLSLPPSPLSYHTLQHADPVDRPAMFAEPGVVPAKWADLQNRLLAEETMLSVCRSDFSRCSDAATQFLAIVELGRKHRGRARLGWINRAVNLRIKPASDRAQYGYADYWASPLQTLTSGAGDCEDYAIVKYVALREAGLSIEDLRLLIVNDGVRKTHHAVLTVRDGDKWLVLDNRSMVMLTIENARQYYPLFVMDYRGVQIFSTVAVLQ